MKKIRSFHLLGRTLLAMCPFLFLNCEKDLGSLGLEQISDQKSDFLFTDSLSFVTYTGFDDSIPTSLTGRLLLGKLQSQEFGISKSAFATNFLLEQINPVFPEGTLLDSVELTLRYVGHYGDTNQPMHIRVFKLEDRLYYDSTYYSNHEFNRGQLLGEATVNPRPNTRVPRGADTISPLLIIKLDRDFFKSFIVDGSRTNPSDFINQDAFMDYFKGIYVEAITGNAILYFNPFMTATAIRLYFRDSDTSSVFRTFRLQGDNSPLPINAVVNLFTNDYSGSNIHLSQDTINGEAVTYVAAMNGPFTIFKITDFGKLKQPDIVINKFEILLPIHPGIEANHISPTRISTLVLSEDGKQKVIKDEMISSSEFSGLLTRGRFRYASYSITLTRQASEALLNNMSDLKLAIKAQNGISTANRTALAGSASQDLKPQIRVFYTKF